ncbi:MAG: hypothetical protein GY712_04555 [Oceanicoccus sp.]|uniref:hypothetical protein n=1 Tax=Oceanicoccus sp. TaxID=2691044 RepID=UPI00261480F5|nr:hypothetical protein [Oceanicoccus sp.]MCP3907268.1 hypothetical protein [Oceanicoccus sp.]MDG1772885.1 hypothetical protein [Oceanicoccus sp.]
MTINAVDLTEHVIKPTLDYLGVRSLAAEKLLLGTAAQESDFDPFYQHCESQSQGIGIYQITSAQHRIVWDKYLAFHPNLASKVRGLASQHQFLKDPDQELKTNLAYSTAIAWVIYLQSEHQLPEANDSEGLGHFWEQYFCHQGSCHAQDFSRWINSYAA